MDEGQTPIQKLYSEPKAKGFINHLIGSYLPISKAEKVWNFKSTNKLQCNVCGQKLFDIETAFENMKKNDEKIRAEFPKFLSKQVNGEEIKLEEHPMYKHITQGALQAWTGQKTDTCLCLPCIKALLDLVQNGILNGDKNMSWIVNKMRREQTFDVFRSSDKLTPEEKEDVNRIEKKVERSPNKKISTFGDLEVLQKLKAKMEEESSNN